MVASESKAGFKSAKTEPNEMPSNFQFDKLFNTALTNNDVERLNSFLLHYEITKGSILVTPSGNNLFDPSALNSSCFDSDGVRRSSRLTNKTYQGALIDPYDFPESDDPSFTNPSKKIDGSTSASTKVKRGGCITAASISPVLVDDSSKEDIVKILPKTSVTLHHIHGVPIRPDMIAKLVDPGEWLSDEHLNGFFSVLQPRFPKCKFLSTFFWPKLETLLRKPRVAPHACAKKRKRGGAKVGGNSGKKKKGADNLKKKGEASEIVDVIRVVTGYQKVIGPDDFALNDDHYQKLLGEIHDLDKRKGNEVVGSDKQVDVDLYNKFKINLTDGYQEVTKSVEIQRNDNIFQDNHNQNLVRSTNCQNNFTEESIQNKSESNQNVIMTKDFQRNVQKIESSFVNGNCASSIIGLVDFEVCDMNTTDESKKKVRIENNDDEVEIVGMTTKVPVAVGTDALEFGLLSDWTRDVLGKRGVFDYDRVVVPLHCGNSHCLAVVDIQNQELMFYDSMSGNHNFGRKVLGALKKYLKLDYINRNPDRREALENTHADRLKDDIVGDHEATLLEKDRSRFEDFNAWPSHTGQRLTPRQEDSASCGVYVAMFGLVVAVGRQVDGLNVSASDAFKFRQRMAFDLVFANGKRYDYEDEFKNEKAKEKIISL
ncbi:hypothetical protein HK096_000391 [Nowakowskiella sp. JEL0078]|nr:hypothetical protein HK096_000391 [Nowakowskiella sp. JEL0078]